MDDTLKEKLAEQLEVRPEDIMDYALKGDGTYTVVLFSFQKYTGVDPYSEPAEEEEEEEELVLPPKYQKAYKEPSKATRVELIDVTNYLGLTIVGPGGKRPIKKDYIAAIMDFKAQLS